MVETTLRDVRHALRMFVQSPAFAFAAVAALTLGIAVNTAIFSVVNAVLLRPLPYPAADRIVYFMSTGPNGPGFPGASPAKFAHFRQQTQVTELASAFTTGLVNYTDGTFPEQLRSGRVSADFFRLFGASTVLGRAFSADEDRPRGDTVVVLSNEFWRTRLNSDPTILGKAISLGGVPHTVIGVLGEFNIGDLFNQPPQLWTPFQLDPESEDHGHYFQTAGRLKEGVTLEQAQARLDASAADFRARFKGAIGPNSSFSVAQVGTVLVRNVRQSLFVLAGAVAFVLLIACANVANLLLVRATGRKREIAIRAALGGTRGQVARQLFLENFVLAAVATGAGLFAAIALTPVLLSLAPAAIPFADTVRLDARVFSFSVVLAVATALLFGVLPSVSMAGADPASALRDGGRGGSPERVRGFRWVVAAQVALATILLVGAGLLVETVRQLTSLSLGFNAHGLVVATLRLPATSGATPEERAARRAQRTQTIIDALSTSSGVSAATATSTAPFRGGTGSSGIQIPGKTFEKPPVTHRHIVTDSYFATLGIPMLKGRGFEPQDGFGAHVAVVTDEFERVLLDGDAVGRRFVLNGDEHTVVGVIKAAKHQRYTDEPQIAMYALLRQLPQWATNTIIARTERDAALMVPEIRRAIIAAEPQASFITLETMDDMTRRSIGDERYRAQLTAAFGVIAVLLCSIGLYGLVARSVSDRRRELGVRLALGADPVSLRRLVLQQALGVVAFGLAAGIPAALLVSYSLRGLLFGVPPASPLIVLLASGAIAIAATAAAFGPALRAGRTDPIEALRG